MDYILVLGAGKSSNALVHWLGSGGWGRPCQVRLADVQLKAAEAKAAPYPNIRAINAELDNPEFLATQTQWAHVVLSLLPPDLHVLAAKACIVAGKPLVTASYVSPEMMALHQEAREAGVTLMNECGLDPGVDHMSTMKLIRHLKGQGVTITAFRSFCGGLVAPASDTNPWGYKFSWNPKNVVLAGQAMAQWVAGGKLRFCPPNKIFTTTWSLDFPGYGVYEGYPNRDSVPYVQLYGLTGVQQCIRGTLRKRGYAAAWYAVQQLGLTDNSLVLNLPAGTTWAQVLESLDARSQYQNFRGHVKLLLDWLELDSEKVLPRLQGTPAQLLQAWLEQKWALGPEDRDLVLLAHELEGIDKQGQTVHVRSYLSLEGKDNVQTAMAQTVGIPMGLVAKQLVQHGYEQPGVCIPLAQVLYEPVLEELATLGIRFEEFGLPQ